MNIGDFIALGGLIITVAWLGFEVYKWRNGGDC